MKKIGILGGTFDPIHNGHLHIAEGVYAKLALDEIRFIPNNIPPHRIPPKASAADRAAMVALAIAPYPHFILDKRELNRPTPSYAVDTLASIKQEKSNCTLFFILGSDAFIHLSSWHCWQILFDYAHLIVVNRPNFNFVASHANNMIWMHELLQQRQASSIRALAQHTHGNILLLPLSPDPASASETRQILLEHRTELSHLPLPQAVLHYILEHKLYT